MTATKRYRSYRDARLAYGMIPMKAREWFRLGWHNDRVYSTP